MHQYSRIFQQFYTRRSHSLVLEVAVKSVLLKKNTISHILLLLASSATVESPSAKILLTRLKASILTWTSCVVWLSRSSRSGTKLSLPTRWKVQLCPLKQPSMPQNKPWSTILLWLKASTPPTLTSRLFSPKKLSSMKLLWSNYMENRVRVQSPRLPVPTATTMLKIQASTKEPEATLSKHVLPFACETNWLSSLDFSKTLILLLIFLLFPPISGTLFASQKPWRK